MQNKKNFLIGFGERLSERIQAPPSMVDKIDPYTFADAVRRLTPKLEKTSEQLRLLPDILCPNDKTIAAVTLNPSYVAKSYYPDSFFENYGFEPVGSRPVKITPERWSKKGTPQEVVTTQIFVSGTRAKFSEVSSQIKTISQMMPGANDIIKIEDVKSISSIDRIKSIYSDSNDLKMEIVLHASALSSDDFIVDGFRKYLDFLGVAVSLERRLYAQGLCFIPLNLPKELIEEVSRFSFLRVMREMPTLRPVQRSSGNTTFSLQLPEEEPLDKSIRVAIFDGGVVQDGLFDKWVSLHQGTDVKNVLPDFETHGTGVTSAFLFGQLNAKTKADRPYSYVDHYRVLDLESGIDEDIYDVLNRITDVLKTKRYNFANISLGPDIPIEDDDVHAWTSVLDEIFSDASYLPTIAAGNGGTRDKPSGNARIQTPADCVNGLTVGACDSAGDIWERAPYSSIGPGRSPGVVKPDLVAFGGSTKEFFWVYDGAPNNQASPQAGTSFAAPLALRAAVGIRAHFGVNLTPLAIKALLIHTTEKHSHDIYECGWGRIPSDISEIVMTDDETARIVYQGTLSPAEWFKFPIPVPSKQMDGKVSIAATLCYCSRTDPGHPSNYTRSGIEIIFRPHEDIRKDPAQLYPNSKAFFQKKAMYKDTQNLRHDIHKWETTLSAEKSYLGKTLKNPTFNIHYNARSEGKKSTEANSIQYALVVTVRSKKTPDLYNQVVSRYRTQLEILRPVIEVPIRTSI